ncbi:MAG: carbamoyltransferase [Pontiellaceae bacterium]|nr:carbamoyltransferase [Pontiellaceae bacterium]MBN2786198.1 carbamoyltransferase [Pontiellaceae bacterium]
MSHGVDAMGEPTYILGISAFYHDSAAALLKDGRIVAAAQEERFTRKKHDYTFPTHAVRYCLDEAGIDESQLDHVVFYEKPLLRFERLLETYVTYAPRGFKQFLMSMPLWLKQKLHLPREMDAALNYMYKGRYLFCGHHESHAASAFLPSPFTEAAIVTMDGVGEWATASIGVGQDNTVEMLQELRFPHSLGLLYSAFTYFSGFRVNSGEYKLMGLAPYGRPIHYDKIMSNMLDLREDGSFRLNMDYFAYCYSDVMTSRKFERFFGLPRRKPESPLTQQYMDIAASIQKVTEEIMLRMVRHAHRLTGKKNLVLAGGVALNCVGNGRIRREGPFEHIWIQPAAGDAGGALGAALFVWHQLLENPRKVAPADLQNGSLLGPSYSNDEVRNFLDSTNAVYRFYNDENELVDVVSDAILKGQVVGWFQGKMEFGPRALGSRSIIGDARSTDMQSRMNLKIKFRESFRPFAPSVLEERAGEYFGLGAKCNSPYMLLVAPVDERQRLSLTEEQEKLTGIDLLKVKRSSVPGITHVDYSARVQTVDPERHGRYYRLIKRFEEKTGCPLIINTSFNIRGEPIVCMPENAYRCFMATGMDVLVLENCVLLKAEQPRMETYETGQYLSRFELD